MELNKTVLSKVSLSKSEYWTIIIFRFTTSYRFHYALLK